MSYDRIFLGLSLTTLLQEPGPNDLIIDFWEGGSSLYGWDHMGSCVDRLPIYVTNPECIERLGGTPQELDSESELIGEYRDYLRKFSLDVAELPQWFREPLSKVYIPREGWCQLFRTMISGVRSERKFGEIIWIDLNSSAIKMSQWGLVRFRELFNTFPLEYLVRKIKGCSPGEASRNFPFEPLYVSVFIVKGREEKFRTYLLGKRKFFSVAVVKVPMPHDGDYSLMYSIIPYTDYKAVGGFRQKAYSDLKRLGVSVDKIVFERSYFEKYGVLGKASFPECLKMGNVVLSGRLGEWREKGICDITSGFG